MSRIRSKGLVRSIYANNTSKQTKFLDVDMSKFLPGTQTQASVTAEDSAQMFVALYCFYSHVKVVDDAYVCDLTNAQEIQVSERVFRSLSGEICRRRICKFNG